MPDLPVRHILPDLRQALSEGSTILLQAPPGAGKTTLVPIALLNEPYLEGKKIVMLEPRRLAARGGAWRIAELLKERVGGLVGYRMRGETSVGRETRIEVVTEGVLTRMLQSDPTLEEYGVVIFDEFHERSLQADLGLALTLQTKELFRDDLRIVVMSATLEVEPILRLLGDVPVLRSEGRMFPVETRYVGRDESRRIEDDVAATVARALREESEGDLLVFLPGYGEISRTAERLRGLPGVAILPLHGVLSREAQDRAIKPSPSAERKIVLATSIAETSLTIEGVRVVVDSGLSRVPRFDPGSGMARLETVRVSQGAAEQRRGRAGRVAPGVCYRLWHEREHTSLLPSSTPEILEADLLPLALDLLRWGASPEELRWIDPPPPGTYAAALELLHRLGATDKGGALTNVGEQMAALPLHPRLAHMVIRAAERGELVLASLLAALLEERDMLRGEPARADQDIYSRLDLLGRYQRKEYRDLPSEFDRRGGDRVLAEWERIVRIGGDDSIRREMVLHVPTNGINQNIGSLLALAYPDRIAQRREGRIGQYLMSNGQSVRLNDGSSLSREEYLVVCGVSSFGSHLSGTITLAASIALDQIREIFASQIEVAERTEWKGKENGVVAFREERFSALTLSAKRVERPDEGLIVDATVEGVRSEGLSILTWTKELMTLCNRITFLHRRYDSSWPDMSDAWLMEHLDVWLRSALEKGSGRNRLKSLDLRSAILSLLDWEQIRDLDRLAPERIEVPSGSHIKVDYSNPEEPVLPVRLQEMFGATETPRIAKRRVLLTIHLLSPAHRPVQVTQDLPGFWERTYAEVKKELKGRYPKHYWPDDPLVAEATRKTKRHLPQ
ncbi:MAG: ATP-dependent helicase HrpB [Ignavibacteriae bacterium]|nr:ATP-dependent helicase HrpB [Ignavibacteriota bacterium]MCB9214609.1 ATP-dependent helicase HrpB [Ignavibacteria bacterium]